MCTTVLGGRVAPVTLRVCRVDEAMTNWAGNWHSRGIIREVGDQHTALIASVNASVAELPNGRFISDGNCIMPLDLWLIAKLVPR